MFGRLIGRNKQIAIKKILNFDHLPFLQRFHTSTLRKTTNRMQELKEEIKDIVREILPGQHHVTTTPPPFFSKFFNGGRSFKSPWPTWEERTFFQVLKWKKEGRVLGLPGEGHLIGNLSPTADSYAATFPPVTPDAAALQNPPSDAIQAFWIGHATVLVQIEGVAFITDPVFEPRCSPLSFAGPLRITPPALTPTTTPPLPSNLDFVVISHNHYDHLCERSIKAIHARQGDSISWFVPLGLKSWFLKRGIKAENVHELDWWQEFEFKGVKIVFLPAQHWSQRGIGYDRNSTLWGSWAVLGAKLRFWFAGDTGYFPGFKEIGEKIGPFDLAAIPTGAYSPRWYMQTQHIDAAGEK